MEGPLEIPGLQELAWSSLMPPQETQATD
jgi:hypothetical protein